MKINQLETWWKQTQFKANQTQYKANTNPIPEMSKMNANAFSQKDYENETAFGLRQNKPNTNPIKPNQTQFLKIPISNGAWLLSVLWTPCRSDSR